jgi:tRNA dimethylallyltransferase
MESGPDQSPLVVIVGETASGKTALAIEMAQQFNGEIIAADSRTVYKGLDIGTAKPTAEEQQAVPHHLLDVVTPDQVFTAADFQRLTKAAINQISNRGGVPLLVGGSGLYVDAVLYDFEFRGPADEERRKELQGLSVERLQEMISEQDLPMPENSRNARYLIRTLETAGIQGKRKPLRPNTLVLGLTIDREELRQKLAQRVDLMVEQGLVHEVETMAEIHGWAAPGLQAPGYKAFHAYVDGEIPLEEAKALFTQNDMQLAKRQRTWFRRSPDIHWISKKEEGVDLITTFLNKGSIAKP